MNYSLQIKQNQLVNEIYIKSYNYYYAKDVKNKNKNKRFYNLTCKKDDFIY